MAKRDSRPAGKYANYFEIGYNAFEFLMDFGQFYEGSERAELCTRIIMNPAYAKSFLKTVQKSIEAYEEQFGCIEGDEQKDVLH